MTRTEELILQLQRGNTDASELLVQENAGLIWSIAKRFTGRGVEMDDLYQLGCVGFLKAIEGFDLSYGTQFSTYAVPKISGEIRRFLRDDGSVKVSRSVKETAMTVKTARCKLALELGRDPTVSEIADATGFAVEQIAFAETATASTESIHSEAGEDGFTLESVLSDTESEESMLEKIALRQAVRELPHREAMVVRLRYFHGLTQARVAKVMEVSQVQVSRIEKKALEHLRQQLA